MRAVSSGDYGVHAYIKKNSQFQPSVGPNVIAFIFFHFQPPVGPKTLPALLAMLSVDPPDGSQGQEM